MKVHVVSLFLTFLVIPISASAESITCNQLGYFSNGVVLVTPDQNNPDVIETPIGETSVNYGGATLWCVGGLKKAGYIAPMVSGPEEFTLLSYSNCMGVYSEGSCCKTNIAFMPKTPGIKRGVVFQEENILNTNGTVLEKQMRCVDIQGIGSGEQISFDLKLYDENGNVIDRNFQEMEPSRYSCGKVKNDTLNTRKFVIKCLQDDSNNPGIKTQISGCKVKVGLAGEIQNGGHDITTHIESSDRYGTSNVP